MAVSYSETLVSSPVGAQGSYPKPSLRVTRV